jgi:hypothetical protein
MNATCIAALGTIVLLAGCGPTAEQQAAMDAAQRAKDQNKCGGFGFAPGSDAFAHCMMQIASQRDAEAAADRRAAAARDAADRRAKDAAKAAKDQADRDAWDRKTGQGAYSSSSPSSSSSSFSFPNPVDPIRDSIDQDMRKMEGY